MHFAFIDIAYDYTVDRPDTDTPLGGTTTALCFLARALRAAGHKVTVFNKVTAPASAHDVLSLPLEMLTEERTNPAYDGFIFCGRWTEWLVAHVAEVTRKPLIAWMHEARFGLNLVPALPQFHTVVFVSAWQARINQAALLPQQRSVVIRNAINPRVAALFPPEQAITTQKQPSAVYVGATPRGLLHLPTMWPLIQEACPELTLQIFANPALGRDAAENAAFAAALRAMPGVTHVGQVGQLQLAEILRTASIFLAPNPYPETSCLALLEALAAGLCCFTTNRAALPESAQGFATLFPITAADDPDLFTQDFDAVGFAQAALPEIQQRLQHPAAFAVRLRQQVDYFQAHYHWPDRVPRWINVLSTPSRRGW